MSRFINFRIENQECIAICCDLFKGYSIKS